MDIINPDLQTNEVTTSKKKRKPKKPYSKAEQFIIWIIIVFSALTILLSAGFGIYYGIKYDYDNRRKPLDDITTITTSDFETIMAKKKGVALSSLKFSGNNNIDFTSKRYIYILFYDQKERSYTRYSKSLRKLIKKLKGDVLILGVNIPDSEENKFMDIANFPDYKNPDGSITHKEDVKVPMFFQSTPEGDFEKQMRANNFKDIYNILNTHKDPKK